MRNATMFASSVIAIVSIAVGWVGVAPAAPWPGAGFRPAESTAAAASEPGASGAGAPESSDPAVPDSPADQTGDSDDAPLRGGPICNDGNACTTDVLGPTGRCTYSILQCDDGNPATQEACNPTANNLCGTGAAGCVSRAVVCEGCGLTITAAALGAGSSDTEGDIEALCITRVDGQPLPCVAETRVCGLGSHAIELTVVDNDGQRSTCCRTFSIVDTTPPVITCPPDITIYAKAPYTPEYTGWATAEDACDGQIPPSGISFTGPVGTPPCPGSFTRTWTAVDAAGHPASCQQTITRGDPRDCCSVQTTSGDSGCSDPLIESCVCNYMDEHGVFVLEHCCTDKWSQTCVDHAELHCDACACEDECASNPPPHDCCRPHATPGCTNTTIQAAVCAIDNFCCTDAWDATCVSAARSHMPPLCPALVDDCPTQPSRSNGVPDECEANCDEDAHADSCEQSPPTCPTGACCLGIACEEIVGDACALRHGSYAGDGTSCLPGTCDDCNRNVLVDQAEITSGTAVDCNLNGLPDECEAAGGVPGECGKCCHTNGSCENTLPAACSNGTFYGAGTVCATATCTTPTGACCDFGAATCRDTTVAACSTGVFLGNATLCASAACVDCNANGVRDGLDLASGTSLDCNSNAVPDECDATQAGPDCNANMIPDECESLGGDCDGNSIPDACDLLAGAADCQPDGIPDRCQLMANDCNGNEVPDECETVMCVLRVRPVGTSGGTEDGLTWETAFTDLQVAIDLAGAQYDVWVMAGTYKPSLTGDRAERFVLHDGTRLLGGFDSDDGAEQDSNPALNATILSGDLEDDDATDPTQADNSRCLLHVPVGSKHVVIDGFTITGTAPHGAGEADEGALKVVGASVMVKDCLFGHNRAQGTFARGSAANITSSAVTFMGCMFSANSSDRYGGAIYAANSTLELEGCQFANNAAGGALGFGGAIYAVGGSLTLERCRFCSNLAVSSGGGVYAFGAVVQAEATVWRSNSATQRDGGGVALVAAQLSVTNCLLHGNAAGGDGGALASELGTSLSLVNTTLVNNQASGAGGALASRSDLNARMQNSIVWANAAAHSAQVSADQTELQPEYTTIEDGWPAGVQLSMQNPQFQGSPTPASDCADSGPDEVYRLSATSPMLNAGSNAMVETGGLDVAGSPRLIGLFVDHGAYEMPLPGACCSFGCDLTFHYQCSFYCGVADHLPASFIGCHGDADGSGQVNSGDRGFISVNIGNTEAVNICRYDMDGNGVINAGDRGVVSTNIGQCHPLPDWQNGSGLNQGVPDTRFGTATFLGVGTTCGTSLCP